MSQPPAPSSRAHESESDATQRRGIVPTWMTRDIGLLVGARGFMSAGRALAGVVVPIYLTQLGFSAQILGVLFAVVAIASAVMSALIGTLSDRIGRKPFLVLVPLLTALSALLFPTTRVAALLFLFAALGSFGRGAGAGAGAIGPYQPAEQAYLADSIQPRFRNSMFGVVAFASSVGALVGGPIALLADGHPFGLSTIGANRLVFGIMGALSLTAGLLAIPITNRAPAPRPPAPSATRRAGRLVPRLSRESWATLRKLWVTNVVNGFAVGFFGPFITLWFYERYHASEGTIGVLFAVINLFAILSNLGAAPVAQRLGLVRAIVIGRVLQAVLLIPMVLAPTFWLAGAFYLVRMMAQRLALPLRQSFVMGVVPAEERGTVGALSNLPSQGSSAISPAIAGWLFQHISLDLPFEVGAVLQGINAGLFFLFFHAHLPPEERDRPRRGWPPRPAADPPASESPTAPDAAPSRSTEPASSRPGNVR